MKILRTCCAAVMCVLALCRAASAGMFTNPAYVPSAGTGTFGIDYFSESVRFKPKEAGGFGDINATIDQIHARQAYSIFRGNEVVLGLGASLFQAPNLFADGVDFESVPKFSAFAGLKQSFEIGRGFSIGGAAQYTWFFQRFEQQRAFTLDSTATSETIKIEDMWDVDAALAMSYTGGWYAPYAGAFISWKRLKAEATSPVPVNGLAAEKAAYYSADRVAGLLVGLDLVSGRLRGNIEFQLSGQLSGGAGISYVFQ